MDFVKEREMKIKQKIKKMLVDYTMKQFPEEFFKEPVIETHDAKIQTIMAAESIPLREFQDTDGFEDFMKMEYENLARMIAEKAMPYMEFSTHEDITDRRRNNIIEARLKVVTGEDVWRTCKMR